MIKIICGPKGSGKTKRIIDAANEAVKTAKGHLIFVTDTKRYMYDLKREIRFIDVSDIGTRGGARGGGWWKGRSRAAMTTNICTWTGSRGSRANS